MEESLGGKTKYSWSLDSKRKSQCFPSPESFQSVINLWEAVEAMPFHDETLMDATKKINRRLATAAKKSPDPKRELCFIEFEGRPFLVWSQTHRDALIPQDDPETVAKALGLR